MTPRLTCLGAVLAIVLTAAAFPVHAQQRPPLPVGPAPPATRLEQSLMTPGQLQTLELFRTSDRLGLLVGLTVDAVLLTPIPIVDPMAVSRPMAPIKGMRVVVDEGTSPTHRRTSYVDDAELAALSDAIAQMITRAGQWSGREESRAMEARFATSGGFVVGFRQDIRNQEAYIQAGLDDVARRTCSWQDLPTVKAAIDATIAFLKNKTPAS